MNLNASVVLSALTLLALSPDSSFAEPQAPGERIVGGVSDAVKGTAKVTGEAVDYVATGAKDVTTGTVDLVGKGVNTVTDEVTEKPVDPTVTARMGSGVNCKTASSDIAILKRERASTTTQVKNGVKSVLPVTAAVRLLQGDYVDGVKVAAGQYNADVDARIAEIQSTCNVH